LLLDTGALPELVWIPIKAVTCGAAAFLMVVLSGTLVREKERRRRGRMERLRL
jgi:hypothetical protein